jgi:hypothetical protein
MVFVPAFVLIFCPIASTKQVVKSEKVKQEKIKAKNQINGSEVMELRLFLKDGKIVWVEPIDPREVSNSKAAGKKYDMDIVPDLSGEGIQEISKIAIKQNSPGCSYWYVYETRNGVLRICLK